MSVTLTLVNGSDRFDYEWHADRQLARDMLTYLRDKLAEHGWTFTDITGIGVFRGPGSYTGLRIGMTVLNTLAAAQAVPIVGSTMLDEWQADCENLLASGVDEKVVLPEYGADAHTTEPRK